MDEKPCWECFLTPEVEVDEAANIKYLTYTCDIAHRVISIYFDNDAKFDHRPMTTLAVSVFPVCLACTKRKPACRKDSIRADGIGTQNLPGLPSM